MKKKYSALIALVLALVLGYFGINLNALPDVTEPATIPTTSSVYGTEPEATTLPPETSIPETTAGEKKITVTVVHGDGSEKTFTYDTDEEYLGAVLVDAGLIQGNDGRYGLEMHTVDGEKADWNENKSYWALYIGEEYALTGVDSTPIADGAVFKLVYTIG